MHKNAKAAIATAAGVLLLLGGGSSLALWNTSSEVDGSSIGVGVLDFAGTVPSGHWYDKGAFDLDHAAWVAAGSGTEPVLGDYEILDPASYRLVPGDDLQFRIDGVPVTADGSSLYFTVTPDPGIITATGSGMSPGAGLGITGVSVTGSGFGTPIVASAGQFTDTGPIAAGTPVFHVTGHVTGTFDVAFELTFDSTGVADQSLVVSLSDGAVRIQQVVRVG